MVQGQMEASKAVGLERCCLSSLVTTHSSMHDVIIPIKMISSVPVLSSLCCGSLGRREVINCESDDSSMYRSTDLHQHVTPDIS